MENLEGMLKSGPSNPGRRKLLRLPFQIAGAVVAAGVIGCGGDNTPEQTIRQKTAPVKYDVAYTIDDSGRIWAPEIDTILEYQEDIERTLGPTVGRNLRIVQGKEGFGLVYNRDGTKESSERIAGVHSGLLKEEGLHSAVAVDDSSYNSLYNISFGLGRNQNALRRDYDRVLKALDDDIGKELFIERTDRGNFALVHRLRAPLQAAKERAGDYSRKLEGTGISASWIRESNNEIVYGESVKLAEEIEKEPSVVIKPPVKKPETQKPVIAIEKPTGIDSELERLIERQIDGERSGGNVAGDERTAWIVYDHSTGEKLVSINEAMPMQTASMKKILVAFYDLNRFGDRHWSHLKRMIQFSDNVSTNWVMSHSGGPNRIQKFLREEYANIFQGTNINDYIPLTKSEMERAKRLGLSVPSGRSYYSNLVSAHDYSRFLHALWNRELPYSKELLELMALPNRNRLYDGARKVPAGTAVYHRTGSSARCCGDVGILVAKGKDGKRYPYTIIGIIEKNSRASDYFGWRKSRGDVIRRVSNTVYEYMKQRHNLI